MTDDLQREIDALYAEPPESFTEARDALVKRLKADGDAGSAKRVGALRKPVRSAWAVNRLVREERSSIEELIAVGERLRTAQQRAMSGAGADELRERSDERRKLVTGLAQRAATLLEADEPPAALLEDVSATLEAASIDEDAARQVLEARLVKPLRRPAGFGDVSGLRAMPGGRASTERDAPARASAEQRAEERRHERERRAAEERERKAREHVERLRAGVEDLQRRLGEKKDELRAAEAEARGAAVEARRLGR
jgi:hypothetical protein